MKASAAPNTKPKGIVDEGAYGTMASTYTSV